MNTFKLAEQIFPIYQVEHDCIVSAMGDLTVGYRLQLPEIFTLSDDEYLAYHQAWVRAIQLLPQNSVVHKQEYHFRASYHYPQSVADGLLSGSAARHFTGRGYLNHESYVFITQKAADRRPASSALSGLMRRNLVPRQTTETAKFHEFLDKAGQFERILRDSGFIKLQRLTDQQLAGTNDKPGLIERYCFLLGPGERPLLKDIHLRDRIQIGSQQVQLYTLADAENLPALCGSRITYEPFSTDQTKFPIGFAAQLNLLLDCNHIYNQYIFIGDAQKKLKQLEAKKLRLQSLSAYSRENSVSRDATNDFLNEAISQQRLPVLAHFNIAAWTDGDAELQDLKNKVGSAMAQLGANAKLETDGAPQIWWAGLPGNAADFPMNDAFDTFLEPAACFLNLESNYRSTSPDQGIRFCDRLSAKPVFVDMLDQPRSSGLTANMGMLICGTSGGGKSMTANHILHSLYAQGAHCVTLDIGGSYKGLCELVNGYYFTYEENKPICFNPFYLSPGQAFDTEKKESLKTLLVSLWKMEHETFNRSEYVALSNALQGYYDSVRQSGEFPCFNNFFEYLENEYTQILQTHRVKDRDFDIDSFLYVLRPFYKGGEFDYLLNATDKLDLLEQRFVVIELDNIKDHPILFPVVTLMLMEMFLSKMRKLKGVRKILTIDEAWKAIANAGMAGFIKYAFKTMRKFNGVPNVITQELDDLVSSPIIKDAIINNADIKILMDMRGYQHKFHKIQEVFGLSEKAKQIILSANKEQREISVILGGQSIKVYKNELCREEYYAYTTEGRERVRVQEYAARYGSIAAGIAQLVSEEKKQKQQS